MKLNDERYQWIYDQCNEIKRAVVALDYAKKWRASCSDEVRKRADDQVHHLALSILLLAMGEHIPKSLWTVSDYSVLYGILDDNKDELDLNDFS